MSAVPWIKSTGALALAACSVGEANRRANEAMDAFLGRHLGAEP